jgi:hypothetical protein
MATENVMDGVQPPILSIGMNSWGNVTFDDLEFASMFARTTASRLASLTHVLIEVHHDIDGGFMTDILELVNDMAFQMHGVTQLLHPATDSEAT